jgi:hypothetical protein
MCNILVVVEGNKTEPIFLKQLNEVYDLDYTIFCLSTNIYTLYKRVKELDFECDIRGACYCSTLGTVTFSARNKVLTFIRTCIYKAIENDFNFIFAF